MAVPAFVFVEAFRPLLPYGLGFAAGVMTWMVFAELLPDARRGAPDRLVAVVVALCVFGMLDEVRASAAVPVDSALAVGEPGPFL
jgi:ZIP family zinc transporter